MVKKRGPFYSNSRRRPWRVPQVDSQNQSDNLIVMETTLTDFQRNFSAARAAADRGETIKVKSAGAVYLFAKANDHPSRPFADLEHLFGVVRRPQPAGSPHETIRNRLKTRRAG
ncbi:MAG: hypothetical protein U1F61_27140 [Opitutaceae bacterium]